MNDRQQSLFTHRCLVTGGTGFVGQRLLRRLAQPLITTRSAAALRGRVNDGAPQLTDQQVIEWNPNQRLPELASDQRPVAVINLMGESVAEGRWTAAKKQRIRDSRVVGTQHLVSSLIEQHAVPQVLISASAVGLYGSRGDDYLDESSAPGEGFLTDVCREWEQAAAPLAAAGTRVVYLRIGIVLGKEGGAMAKLVPLFRWGLGGRLGSGQHWLPWIHADDLVQMIVWLLDAPIHGPCNGVGPQPVRNQEFTKTLAAAVHRPAIIPAPAWALRLALGEFADSLLFSQRVLPRVALDNGFQFQYQTLESAVRSMV